MLSSMTGYGEASFQSDALTIGIELRAVNNRYLKVTLRTTEPYHLLEPEFEKVIRKTIRRGTVQVSFRCQRQQTAQNFQINVIALRSYVEQLRKAAEPLGPARPRRGASGPGAGVAWRGARAWAGLADSGRGLARHRAGAGRGPGPAPGDARAGRPGHGPRTAATARFHRRSPGEHSRACCRRGRGLSRSPAGARALALERTRRQGGS